ncbi:MAG: pyruvate:ferredoxin (flavodoxin) oxidoreductase [Bacteroidales bacterium]|jgi:pyruvate-ferredoxin/flavodoxin oxidoreductase|nr:pyruvate:ferredoxin (flavodoxin) oxidoreductase [Bacteroidales bacterium]MDD3692074.1 pyruvate:ferredoxin (flavodoxin) oxidoreductase [Bacteroidales bacterium]MDD4582093.1 pyruvate:ferredoxin (flavodoxin) oxidoreductase [Bacteroidales bacterium]MDX9889969.1 pyruvate:ferredoxin (flavodoxin) oxidoreductase [Bacteroidales bacterium]NLO41755.1 pyruvate:ferredoxin (flavodoxin) oxidoreductase [Bacteroidales bacterium]
MAEKKYMTCDGNYAAAHVAYMFSEVAAIYPITPSSTMAEYIDEWAAGGRKNVFGEPVKVVEMQSEAGAAGAVHGSLQAGALTSTFTASQGLLLMIPNMYKIAGELLPGVFHVSARALAAQALSIFGDHSDVMSTRQTGFAMLATGSVQEIMDLAPIAHLAAVKARVPFLHFFDGFRTSHEIQKVEAPDQDKLFDLMDKKALSAYRQRALNPEHPVTRGTAQNPDIYFQTRELQNKYYDVLPEIIADYMKQISQLTGREYAPFTYYGAKDATHIVVAMGSVTETIKTVVDKLTNEGKKVGVVSVHLYRPFSVKYLNNILPKTVERICVLDRTKETGANGDPLYLDIVEAFANRKDIACDKKPLIIGGRYGLSSKDTTPAHILSVFQNLEAKEPKNQFTISIVDDVTHKSLPLLPDIFVLPKGTFEAKFYGLGADGTVGANKNSIKIIGDNTNKYSQAYFDYDSKKSGGYTCSHLRFGDHPIRAPYLVGTPDFVAVHVPSYLRKYDCLRGLKQGGTFLYNSPWDVEETKKQLPDNVKKYLAVNKINMYMIDATAIAEEIGLGNRTNTILQSAFFKISGVIPYDLAVDQMKKFIVKSYGRKGDNIIKMNYAAVDRGGDVVKVDIPAEWANIEVKKEKDTRNIPDFIKNVMEPMVAQKGNDLPVSAFLGWEDGTFPAGTTAYEKRGVAVNVPQWIPENCIQCNQCSLVCPHAAIRPVVMNADEKKNAPSGMQTLEMKTPKEMMGMHFRMQVSVLDCTGCGNCADVCPAKTKALEMKPFDTQLQQVPHWEYAQEKVTYKDYLVDKSANVKNSQFAQPLFEFSGACAGCGETPYIKGITQLFGEQMMIANATGCSSIYGGSAPATPYCPNKRSGHGPAWANSLFEDNAEYGFGMATATRQMRDRIQRIMNEAITSCNCCSDELKGLFKQWIENRENTLESKKISDKIVPLAEKCDCSYCKDIVDLKHYLVKKSQWIFGGDGWAYDIGFGGLDHVLASGENVNVLVLDTEVYSNTGGQSSKATPAGAVAKFATSGKKIRKKDLGMIAKSYGYVYVAQVAMGASQAQYFKAIKEAEAYNGPSLIIAYAPCINHGIKAGMGRTQEQEKLAVECGYWHLWRFNPDLETEGKNGFILDSKEPDWSKFQNFIMSEVRYNSLLKTFPQEAEMLFKATEENAKWRYNGYKKLAEDK